MGLPLIKTFRILNQWSNLDNGEDEFAKPLIFFSFQIIQNIDKGTMAEIILFFGLRSHNAIPSPNFVLDRATYHPREIEKRNSWIPKPFSLEEWQQEMIRGFPPYRHKSSHLSISYLFLPGHPTVKTPRPTASHQKKNASELFGLLNLFPRELDQYLLQEHVVVENFYRTSATFDDFPNYSLSWLGWMVTNSNQKKRDPLIQKPIFLIVKNINVGGGLISWSSDSGMFSYFAIDVVLELPYEKAPGCLILCHCILSYLFSQ